MDCATVTGPPGHAGPPEATHSQLQVKVMGGQTTAQEWMPTHWLGPPQVRMQVAWQVMLQVKWQV